MSSLPDPNEAAHRYYLNEIKNRVNTFDPVVSKTPANDKLPASQPSQPSYEQMPEYEK